MSKRLAISIVIFVFSLVASAKGPRIEYEMTEGELRGEYISFKMDDSAIYPGTERTITAYVPKEYDGSTPACLIVRFDGLGQALLRAMDELIAAGSMPVAIAVGIEPGKIYDEAHETVIRYNRSNEFDRTDGRMASFLETEVIPKLMQQSTSDGRRIAVSDKASDRAITGLSSGGIAAFNVAWQRPDLFSRVYSYIGTFVPFRYGDQFPGIIRKTEPKRLRIFLQDNDEDTWNPLFGSWYEYNQLMASALKFAGYEFDCHWDKGGHSGTPGDAILPQVLEWLWKGWPAEVGKGTSANASLAQIVNPSYEWKEERDGIPAGSILVPVEGRDEPEVSKPRKRFDPLSAIYPGGGMKAVASPGSCWVTNSILENGKFCYEQEYYCLHSPATQICFDTNGYLYCATDKGIQICDHNGRVRVILSIPSGPVEAVSLVENTLWAVSGGRLWSRKINRNGFVNPLPVPAPPREDQG